MIGLGARETLRRREFADFHLALLSLNYLSLPRIRVCVVTITVDGALPHVRHFWPVVEQLTVDLPSGHVNEEETPEQSARKELLQKQDSCPKR